MKAALIIISLILFPLFVFTQSKFNFGIKSQLNYTMYTAHSEQPVDGNLFKQDYLNAGGAIGLQSSFTKKQLEFLIGIGFSTNQIGLRADRIVNNDPKNYCRYSYIVHSKYIDLGLSVPFYESENFAKYYFNFNYQFLFSSINGMQGSSTMNGLNGFTYEYLAPEFERFYSQNIGVGLKMKKLVFNSRILELGMNYNYFLNRMPKFGMEITTNSQTKEAFITPQIQQLSLSMAFWFGKQ
ncbi:MAG: hypothetical protein ACK46Y_14735 [Fluviicola sp.]